MRANLIIEMDNAAFEDNGADLELGEILHKLADKIEREGLSSNENFILRDSNGNRVGMLEIEGLSPSFKL